MFLTFFQIRLPTLRVCPCCPFSDASPESRDDVCRQLLRCFHRIFSGHDSVPSFEVMRFSSFAVCPTSRSAAFSPSPVSASFSFTLSKRVTVLSGCCLGVLVRSDVHCSSCSLSAPSFQDCRRSWVAMVLHAAGVECVSLP